MEEKNQISAPASNGKESARVNAVGLDIGTSRIVVADGAGAQKTRSQLNAFVAVPASDMAENVLKQRQMVYERNCQYLYVYGNDSDFFASFLNTDARRPMQHGVLNPREEMSQTIIQLILNRLVGPPRLKGESLCFSVPGKGEGANGNLVYHEAVLKSYLQSLGYNAKALNEGQAVVFSELQDENFTGIGISCGGGMCNVSVSFMSMPMITFSIPKGGDYIDENVATVLNETSTRVRLFKEEKLNLSTQPKDDLSRALHIYYEDVMQALIDRLRAEFRASGQLPKIDRPMSIVVAGGTAKPAGFLHKFESMLRAGGDFPVPLAEIRMAKDPLVATAQGCHIAALSETR
ncbi:MAG TPA: cell division protein FtsA [Pyrinomonadaceae bacterium]|nr:cell division protein FtsA [Pyrinomonadaceae bacterium]